MATETNTRSISKEQVDAIREKLIDAAMHFGNIAAAKDDIMIFMPEYFRDIFSDNLHHYRRFDSRMGRIHIILFCGIKVYEGYENSVVVSVSDNVLNEIEPIKIKIPCN